MDSRSANFDVSINKFKVKYTADVIEMREQLKVLTKELTESIKEVLVEFDDSASRDELLGLLTTLGRQPP